MDALTIAANYLAPHGDAFWRWSKDTEALEWSDGTAIAFYQEVESVIEILGTHQLPPFQSIVILLGACQYNWLNTSRFQLLIGYTQLLDKAKLEQRLPADWQQQLRQKLDGVHELLSKQQATTDFKRTIAERLFESGTANHGTHRAAPVLEQLQLGIPALVLSKKGDTSSVASQTDEFITTVRALLGGDWTRDAESVQSRIDTGLSQLPNPAEFQDDAELPDVERLRRLLTHLATTGEELGGIARVAQNLMAAVHLPRAIAEPEQMPLGGFSDISNRGPLDRLLITELAHDNETLAVRVALNEALYLRRESPPKTPQRRRAILIDTGIRLWGVPRVFATAIALALAATAEKLAPISAYRAEGDNLQPADLLTREGVIAQLSALEPAPHPAAAAIKFLEHWQAEPEDVDPVLITHQDVLTDPEFRRKLREHLTTDPIYIATVDKAGHYQLDAFSAAGQKRLQHATIDLAQLLDPPEPDSPGKTELLRDDIDPDLPTILSMQQFPLRISYQYDPSRSLFAHDVGVIGHTRDGRLLHWDEKNMGARIVSCEIPKGNIVWQHLDADERTVHLLIFDNRYTLFSTDLRTGSSQLKPLAGDFVAKGKIKRAYCHYQQSLFIVVGETADMFALADGKAIGSIQLHHSTRTNCGRFFRFGGKWFALSGDLQPKLDKILHVEALVHVFESSEFAVPLAITVDGELIALEGNQPRVIVILGTGRNFDSVVISDDTRRLALICGNLARHCDLSDPGAIPLPIPSNQLERILNPEKFELGKSKQSPHINFRFIACSPLGFIYLVANRGGTHSIQCDGPGQGIVLRQISSTLSMEDFKRFEEIPAPGAARFKLQRAEWACGTRAYLDARGFLHIAPISNDLPEITLALRDGLLSGWTSDGKFFGQEYYTAPHELSDARAVFDDLKKIVARILAFADAQ